MHHKEVVSSFLTSYLEMHALLGLTGRMSRRLHHSGYLVHAIRFPIVNPRAALPTSLGSPTNFTQSHTFVTRNRNILDLDAQVIHVDDRSFPFLVGWGDESDQSTHVPTPSIGFWKSFLDTDTTLEFSPLSVSDYDAFASTPSVPKLDLLLVTTPSCTACKALSSLLSATLLTLAPSFSVSISSPTALPLSLSHDNTPAHPPQTIIFSIYKIDPRNSPTTIADDLELDYRSALPAVFVYVDGRRVGGEVGDLGLYRELVETDTDSDPPDILTGRRDGAHAVRVAKFVRAVVQAVADGSTKESTTQNLRTG
ncbi:hypothetical protein HDU93_008278 [Gonapodya sp. JEL0774]|nr:hypothetical protein HDU93_008278 [Gonapodya sp. JEL0774]